MSADRVYAEFAERATTARDSLRDISGRIETVATAQRELLAAMVGSWVEAPWKVAGASSFQAWARTYTALSPKDAAHLERVGELCAKHDALAEAVISGELSLGRADRITRVATRDREPFLGEMLPTLLRLSGQTADDEIWFKALSFWADRVDEHLKVAPVRPHAIYLTQQLWGGGDVHGSLGPVAFETVATALDAFMQDPDPKDAPHRRSLAERRADALDDLALFGLTHNADDDGWGAEPHPLTDDVADGLDDRDDLDEQLDDLADGGDGLDELDVLRRKARRHHDARRRRACRATKARSGVTVNVHIDIRTLAGRTLEQLREIESLDELEMRGERWRLTKGAVEQMLCDSAMLATLFDGPGHILDANDAAERFNRAQRRAIAARDRHCVFPSCDRHPRHCDTHHIEFRDHGGPTRTANGCLLCRFHHRLVHQVGWKLAVINGRWTATSPDGHAYAGEPFPNGPPDNGRSDEEPIGMRNRTVEDPANAHPCRDPGRNGASPAMVSDPPLRC